MKISVLTATYNRAHLLPNLYESLCKNYENYSNFEWIIVDDGSKDDTKRLVQKWQKKAKFPIVYSYQENQGKMAAINHGMNSVSGEIVIEMDSDDVFVDDAFHMVAQDYKMYKKKNIYGIIYKRKLVQKQNEVSSSLNDKIIRLFDLHNVYGYDFDMTIAFFAKERKKYQYELENHEKFITEARLFYKMDQDYEGLLFKNKELIVCKYFEDGYSKNIIEMFKKYPYGYKKYFEECLEYSNQKTLKKKKFYFLKHYILFCYLTNTSMCQAIKESPKKSRLWVAILIFPGYIKSRKFRRICK